jgi:hypothetical protein
MGRKSGKGQVSHDLGHRRASYSRKTHALGGLAGLNMCNLEKQPAARLTPSGSLQYIEHLCLILIAE